uniref:MATH domain-containing protein n=1 Tax=Panagrellus redivivus TaxID=6233 RepID=A0A7E4WB98_PANRE
MSSSGSDTLEFEIPTFLLEFANDDQYVSSNRRKIGDTSDGYWWLDCYPNNDGNVSVELRVSCKDIAVEYSVAIKGTDVLGTDKLTTSVKSLSKCWDLISHDDLMESDAIQNDAFVLICNAKFEARDNPDESDTKIVEDSLKIEFSNNDLYDATSDSDECWTPSRLIPGYRQLFWSVDYYPRGTCEPGFCAFIRSEYDVKYELAIHYKNMYLKSTMLTPFSQEQLNASSDNDRVPVYVNTFFEVPKVEDIDEIFEMCTVPNGSLAVNAIRLKLSPLLFHEDYIGDFDSSPMQQAQNSDKVEFRMRCYGAGDRPFNKNYLTFIKWWTKRSRSDFRDSSPMTTLEINV